MDRLIMRGISVLLLVLGAVSLLLMAVALIALVLRWPTFGLDPAIKITLFGLVWFGCGIALWRWTRKGDF